MNLLPVAALAEHVLSDASRFYSGRILDNLVWQDAEFAVVWERHPRDKHVIKIRGRYVETPRYQQAYGADYYYTGGLNRALPVFASLVPLLKWAQKVIDCRLNGILLNWYDGAQHYIGPHHDSTIHMASDAPIVTVSFGETRIFRLSRSADDRREILDFSAEHGTVFVVPFATNKAWKHEVPKSTRYQGRRISVTFRAFLSGVLPPEKYYE